MKKEESEMLEHYRLEAKEHGDKPSSTMEDDIVRKEELKLIEYLMEIVGTNRNKVLDLGCGNGIALSVLSRKFLNNDYYGLDFSHDLIKICHDRKMMNVSSHQGDARETMFDSNFLDIVYTERCLINLPSWGDQIKALNEIHRILKPNGYYLLIEAFTDGLKNCNKARTECGLPELKPAKHNLYLDKKKFLDAIESKFIIIDQDQVEHNFLSSHYFISRVLHPLVTKGKNIKNTEFVQFFNSFLMPIGNYSQIQAYLLKKIVPNEGMIVANASRD